MPTNRDKYAGRKRTRKTFRLRALENRAGPNGKRATGVLLEGEPGLLGIWGTRGQAMEHIEEVERAGFPVTIECDWIEPDAYEAAHFNHRHWARQSDRLRIIR